MKNQPEKRFVYCLALRLGMTVSRLLEEVSSRELCEWMAFFALEKEESPTLAPDGKTQKPAAAKGDVATKLKAALGAYNANPKCRQPTHRRRR